ncbi:hypothetical protein S40285_08640 [Stachybotrys chlorohalonatus IBT 40285]|uniref:Protein SYS1 n=1 Tax=Stachybotrys chlorohalonatus (strain IBT 40285) TaxID=1283841 RepID=A0A084QA78_STAC4|nr:hypothetical protein S40285_08640 [Stachybotrys chlorohalonata IBT 40285]
MWCLYRAIAIVALVTRSKLVPDFALTIHFLHLLIVSLYTRSVPRTAMWWLTMSVSAAFSVTLGVWGCRYRELQPVFFGGTRILGAGSTTSAGATAAAASDDAAGAENGDPPQGDEEMGFARGRGRGRGRDGAGEYEMVKLQPPPP